MKKRTDMAMVGSKKRIGAMIGMKRRPQGNNVVQMSPDQPVSVAEQKSVLEKMTKNQQNLGHYA